jgi:hypothetical protein
MQNTKTVFFLNKDIKNPISAGGVLFYRINRDIHDLEFLLIKNREKYEDLGGRCDACDISIKHTVSREVEEESNKIFNKARVIYALDDSKAIYFRHSKYIIYLVELEDKIDPKLFGTKEYHDNIDRTVEWISYARYREPEFVKTKLNFRLKFKALFEKLTHVYKNAFNKPVIENNFIKNDENLFNEIDADCNDDKILK